MTQTERAALPDWPRLMSEPQAAAYLSLSATTLRKVGPSAKRHGRRVLYDRLDLDRWADRLADQPLDDAERIVEARAVESDFFARRKKRASN